MSSLLAWFTQLFSTERRKAARWKAPTLAAYFWNGDVPTAHGIRDTSWTGMYLVTKERWYPNTIVTMTLQRTDMEPTNPDRTIAIRSRVVRSDDEGVGLSFVPSTRLPGTATGGWAPAADEKSIKKFLQQLHSDQGQALIEYLLVLPFIFLLIVNVVNFGGFFYAWIAVANAARAGADYAIMSGSSVGAPQAANGAQLISFIQQDAASLPNAASLVVNVCQNFNGTVTTITGTCTSMPSDPEPTSYVLTTVDVTYTYIPFISAAYKFPGLNIYATLPPTTVHRRAVMRLTQ